MREMLRAAVDVNGVHHLGRLYQKKDMHALLSSNKMVTAHVCKEGRQSRLLMWLTDRQKSTRTTME